MRRRRPPALPTPDELVLAPQLAIVDALLAAIDIAIVALVVAQPELGPRHDGRPDPAPSPVAQQADEVIARAQSLAAALLSYRRLTLR